MADRNKNNIGARVGNHHRTTSYSASHGYGETYMDLPAVIATFEALLAELKSGIAPTTQSQPPAAHDEVLTAAQLAKLLKISRSYIYRHLDGLDPIPHHRLGRVIRFRLAEVTAWMNARSTNAKH